MKRQIDKAEQPEKKHMQGFSRTSSLMIRQNSRLMVELTHPDILIAIGRNRAKQALNKK